MSTAWASACGTMMNATDSPLGRCSRAEPHCRSGRLEPSSGLTELVPLASASRWTYGSLLPSFPRHGGLTEASFLRFRVTEGLRKPPSFASASRWAYGSLLPRVSASRRAYGSLLPRVSASWRAYGSLLPRVSASRRAYGSLLPRVSASRRAYGSLLPLVSTSRRARKQADTDRPKGNVRAFPPCAKSRHGRGRRGSSAGIAFSVSVLAPLVDHA